MADVNISIGATLDELAAGVNAAKDSLGTLQTSVQTLAGYFAMREIGEFVSHMAELGLQAERTAAILGITTVSAQELAGISLLSGGSADQLTSSLSRLQLGLERGQRATSQQAAAFRAMGIDMQQMLSASPDRQVDILANAVQRLHDQGINAAPALSLINRGLASLMPMLQGGAAEVQHFRDRLIEVGGIVSTDTTEKLAVLHQELTLAGEAFKGLGETIAAQGTLKQFAAEVSQATGNLTALIATGNLVDYVMSYLASTADKLGAALVKLGFQALEVGSLGLVSFTKEIAQADAAMKQADNDLRDLNANFERIASTLRGQIAAEAGKGLKPISVDVTGARDAMQVIEQNFKEQSELIKQSYDLYQITERQKTQLLIAEVNKRRDAEIAAGESAKVASAKASADIAKINTDETKQIINQWKSVADTFANDFSQALDQVLSKQASFGKAMEQMFGKMIEQFIAYLIKLFAEWVAIDAASMALGGGPVPFSAVLGRSFQTGTPYVPETGMALVHEGEAIIPSWENPAAGGAAGGGGSVTNQTFGGSSAVNLSISAVDAASFASMIRRNPGAFSSLLDRLSQRGSLATLTRG